MAEGIDDFKKEITFWLKSTKIGEELRNFQVSIDKSLGKSGGYIGDIVFIQVSGENSENLSKSYDLVLKCSKRSVLYRQNFPSSEIFENERHLYAEILPIFEDFENTKGVAEKLDFLPKFYGFYQDDKIQVLILENLKKSDYILWDARKPVTLQHQEIIVKAYARWHAIGAALRDQKPEIFQQLTGDVKNIWPLFAAATNYLNLLQTNFDYVCAALRGHLDEDVIDEFRKTRILLPGLYEYFIGNPNYFTTITHGDCWNNNFLYQHKGGDLSLPPTKAAIIDWQMSYVSSPLVDLSYYLYSSISGPNLGKLDDFLDLYYETFSEHLRTLGSNPGEIFPLEQFKNEWKVFEIYGVLVVLFLMRFVISDMDVLPDVSEGAGTTIHDISNKLNEICITSEQLLRVKFIVQHAVRNGIVRDYF